MRVEERMGESIRSSDGLQGGKPLSPPECSPGSIAATKLHLYQSVIRIAEQIGYLKHPELLKAAMSTTALAVAEFHVQTLGFCPEDAVANMQETRNRLIDPIAQRLDNPTTKKEAMSQAVWFVRSTAQFFRQYFDCKERNIDQ